MRCLPHTRCFKDSCSRRGFTVVELVVVIAILVVLMALQLPAYTGSKTKSKGAQCLNNLKQLSLAWRMYAEDNREYFVYSSDDGTGTLPYSLIDQQTAHQGNNYAWTWSKLDFAPNNAYNYDVNADITKRPLWQYNRSPAIYRCPSDTCIVVSNKVSLPRVRTYSMNFFLGGFGGNTSVSPPGTWARNYPPYTRLTDLADTVHSPGVAGTFLFIEERQDVINWGNFVTDMTGYPVSNTVAVPASYEWNGDLPGAYHERAGGISFCDGHVEMHKWVNGSTTPSGSLESFPIPTPYSSDVAWMQNVAARPH